MKAVKINMVDGAECLAIPGIGLAVPLRDNQGHVIIGQVGLLIPGMPLMPVAETLGSLEEKFNGSVSRVHL